MAVKNYLVNLTLRYSLWNEMINEMIWRTWLTHALAHSVAVVLIKVLWLWWCNFSLHKVADESWERSSCFLKQLHYFGIWAHNLRLVLEASSQGGAPGVPRTWRDPHCYSQSGLEWVENSHTLPFPEHLSCAWQSSASGRKGNSEMCYVSILTLLFFFSLGCTKELQHLYLSLALLTFPASPLPTCWE